MGNDTLDTRNGIFAMIRGHGSGHKSLMKSAEAMVSKFCTWNAGAPPRADNRDSRAHLKKKTCVKDPELERHVCNIVKVMTTDAARDELLAGEDLSLQIFFPTYSPPPPQKKNFLFVYWL